MKAQKGFALLAALWLVVAIATVALQFSLEARERRTVGILASERGIQRGLAEGALAETQARMEQALLTVSSSSNASAARLRLSDPWADADSVYTGLVMVDSTPVEVVAIDLGERLNINRVNELELQNFFSYLLRDFEKSTRLAQAIMDWRDVDTLPRPSGGEVDAYIKEELLALPTNSPFREVEDLRNVIGMTPEIYAEASPYLTTRGNGQVNINAAAPPVLRALPGMTDVTLARILQFRSSGQRITSAQQVGAQGVFAAQLASRVSFTTASLELSITARVGPQSTPTKLTAVLQRGQNSVNVSNLIW